RLPDQRQGSGGEVPTGQLLLSARPHPVLRPGFDSKLRLRGDRPPVDGVLAEDRPAALGVRHDPGTRRRLVRFREAVTPPRHEPRTTRSSIPLYLLNRSMTMRGIAVLVLVVCFTGAQARAGDTKPTLVRSAKTGPWSAGDTWEGGKSPGAGARVQ